MLRTALSTLRRGPRASVPARTFASRAYGPRGLLRPARLLVLAGAGGALAVYAAAPVLLDAAVGSTELFPVPIASEEVLVDTDTGVAFPRVLRVPSARAIPPLTLVGVGVRTVSFLGIRVYSVGFYADLANPALQVPADATAEEKLERIVRSSTCLVRIVPTRSTNYTHLRDGFVRAMQARITAARAAGELDARAETAAQAPLRQLRSLFPNTPAPKGVPLDVLLDAPAAGPRALVFRDLGVVADDWMSPEFVLAYFRGKGISPPLKQQVMAALEDFQPPR